MLSARSAPRASVSIKQYIHQFEAHYRDVRTLQADFTQTSFAWGKSQTESGKVYLARGGKMRWIYDKPEEKIFLSDGKQLFLYVPSEKQLTISSTRDIEDARVPLSLLVSHLELSRAFSRVEFADQALEAEPGDRVVRGYPLDKFKRDYRSVLIEISPRFDIRRLIVFYPDNSTMQFTFTHVEHNQPLAPSLFSFAPPPGTEVIHQ
ncbi:MAG TPA: outer membrane lipoprotein carrier protein LolA [Terriglobia bacterium]|nr:outer membrane lipoprotein carrier protein LolA [Terriglobia bacterium]